VKIHYEVHGDGRPSIPLLPTSAIVPALLEDAAGLPVPALPSVTYDRRGTGRSDRPSGVDAYLVDEYIRDTIAVLDAAATE
jgi:pimeloyl-ACP methyl ester carboxylesterase